MVPRVLLAALLALALALAPGNLASAQVVSAPSESECVADTKAISDALQAFLVTLVTRTCNLRTGFDHVCEAPCQDAIMNIGTVAKGCLRYPSFGDTVFDMMRTTAENAGLGGEVRPRLPARVVIRTAARAPDPTRAHPAVNRCRRSRR